MLKDIRRKVMQIANRLVGQGRARAEAMLTAWKIMRYRALRTKVNGTSFDNRQNVLQLLCKYNPADITVNLVRDRLNAFDRLLPILSLSLADMGSWKATEQEY